MHASVFQTSPSLPPCNTYDPLFISPFLFLPSVLVACMQLGFEKRRIWCHLSVQQQHQGEGWVVRKGRGRHNSAESCLKSEPEIPGLGIAPNQNYQHLSGSKPRRMATKSLPQGRKSGKERVKKLNKIEIFLVCSQKADCTMAGQIAEVERHCKVRRGILEFREPTPRWFHSQQRSQTWVP